MYRLIGLALFAISVSASAAPPPGSSGQYSAWFNSQLIPGTSRSCCGESDGRLVEAEIRDGHYVALVDGAPIDIPEEIVLHNARNPTGSAVLWSAGDQLYCFAPPEGV